MKATAKAAMFIIIMWPAFFALVRPVTRKAKPTCMNRTRNPVMSSQVKLIDTLRWPDLVGELVEPDLGDRYVGRAGRRAGRREVVADPAGLASRRRRRGGAWSRRRR